MTLVGVLHEDGELVAAEARNRIARPKQRVEAPRDLLQESVACIVTEAVVDLLEAVEVDKQHRERFP